MRVRLLWIACAVFLVAELTPIQQAYAFVKGIYITQSTAQHSRRMNYLIHQAKSVGIKTFVIDIYYPNKRYARNIAKVRANGIRYVARIVVFPYGAHHHQVKSRKYWQKRWRRAQYAISLGASAIQLDYIRYKPSVRSSPQNARNIYEVIKFFRHKMQGTGVKLQIDIFGVAAHKPAVRIGQNVPLFANSVDAICPMVYPSHYEPYRHHAVRPYSTVLKSVLALRQQLRGHPHVKVFAFIELYNYRYPMSRYAKIKYIKAQMQAARDGGANGWYAWSARNKYSLLFYVLRTSR